MLETIWNRRVVKNTIWDNCEQRSFAYTVSSFQIRYINL